MTAKTVVTAALTRAETSATTSAAADSGCAGPRVSRTTTLVALPIAARRTIVATRNTSRKPSNGQKFPEVSAQLRLMIWIGPTSSALATDDDRISRTPIEIMAIRTAIDTKLNAGLIGTGRWLI